MDALFTFRTPATDPVTTDAFANVPILGPDGKAQFEQLTPPTSGPVSLNWKNTDGANSIDTRVLGTNNKDAADADCEVVVAAAAIVAGAMRHVLVNPSVYAYYRFQHKATVGAAQGDSQIHGCQKRI